MADGLSLSASFLAHHPHEAARVLESLSTADASALLAAVDRELGARTLAAMLPTAAARMLNAMDEPIAHALLHEAATHAAIAILRHLPEPSRARFIAALSPASALASQMLLGLPEDTVGAWTDPEVLAASPSTRVHEALQRVRAERASDLQHIYVVDGGGRLLGSASLETLVRAPDTELLVHAMQTGIDTVSVMMPVASARALAAWERAMTLPVVDHDRRLIGVLRRSTLLQAFRARARPPPENGNAASVAGALALSYWGIVSTLSGAALALLPGVKRVLPDER